MNQRSALGDFLERYARDRGGAFLNDDGSINTARLGAFLDMSQSQVYRLISGGTRHPRYDTVQQVARRTGTAESVILGEDPEPEVNPHSLAIARKIELLPQGERAMIEHMIDRFLELLRAAADEPEVDDTGRFRTVDLSPKRPRTQPAKVEKK